MVESQVTGRLCAMENLELYREIKKKNLILNNRKPFSREAAGIISELDFTEWIYSVFKFRGESLSLFQIGEILKGEISYNLSLSQHVLINNLKDVISYLKEAASFGNEGDLRLSNKISQVLTGHQESRFRKDNPVIVELSHNPPHPQNIKEQLAILFSWLITQNKADNPIETACLFHHRFIEIYPYEEENETVALCLLYYLIMKEGYPPFEILITENEYNNMLSSYFKEGSIESFFNRILKSLLARLEIIISLTERY